jgi:hypothetical protein
MKKIILFTCLALCFSCLNKESTKNSSSLLTQTTLRADTLEIAQGSYYFSGDYRIVNGKAIFKDCITGELVPISKCAAFEQVNKAYHDLELNTPEGVYCEVMGFLIETPTSCTDAPNHLVITSLIRFARTAACRLGVITGIPYTATWKDSTEHTATLSLLPNYTFELQTQTTSLPHHPTIQAGAWHRLSDENMVLLMNGQVLYEGIVDFTNLNLDLTNNANARVQFVQHRAL